MRRRYGDVGPALASNATADMLRHAAPHLRLDRFVYPRRWPWWKKLLHRWGFNQWGEPPELPRILNTSHETVRFRRPPSLQPKEKTMNPAILIIETISNGLIVQVGGQEGSKRRHYASRDELLADAATVIQLALSNAEDEFARRQPPAAQTADDVNVAEPISAESATAHEMGGQPVVEEGEFIHEEPVVTVGEPVEEN